MINTKSEKQPIMLVGLITQDKFFFCFIKEKLLFFLDKQNNKFKKISLKFKLPNFQSKIFAQVGVAQWLKLDLFNLCAGIF